MSILFSIARGVLRNSAGEGPGASGTNPPVTPPVTPPAPPAPVPAPVVVPPPAAAPGGAQITLSQDAFNERIARAKESALRDAGFTSVEEARAAAEARQKVAQVDTLTRTNTEYLATIGGFATAQLSALTAEQQAAVKAIAGEDPALQLKTITALTPTWKLATPPGTAPGTAPVTPPAKPIAPPAQSAPNAPPPAPPGVVVTASDAEILATYEAYEAQPNGQYMARLFYASNAQAIMNARAAKK